MTPPTVRRSSVDAAEDFLGVPVLASIPAMHSTRDRERRRRHRSVVAWSLAAVLVILLVVAFVLLR